MNRQHRKNNVTKTPSPNSTVTPGAVHFSSAQPRTKITFWYVLTIFFSVPAAFASAMIIGIHIFFLIDSVVGPGFFELFLIYALGAMFIQFFHLPALAMSIIGFLMSLKSDPQSDHLRKVGVMSLVLSLAYIVAIYTSIGFYAYTVLSILLLVWLAVYKKVNILLIILLALGLIMCYIAILFASNSPVSPELMKDFFLFRTRVN